MESENQGNESGQYSVEKIKERIQTDYGFAIQCLLKLYERQTTDEQLSEETKHVNNIGFSGADANILSSFAKQVLQWKSETNPRYPSPLSPRQMEILRKKLQKYAKTQIPKIFSSSFEV
jgi:hypothetical protein